MVALHRAAYLLYTHRERLERRGVLILGPNPAFLRYIEQVLPSLGETDVLLSTIGELYPGVRAEAAEDPRAAALKGEARMAEVIAAAVRDWQRMPDEPVEIHLDRYTLRLDRRSLEAARQRALRSRRPHNQARAVLVRHLLTVLARQAARRLGKGLHRRDRAGGPARGAAHRAGGAGRAQPPVALPHPAAAAHLPLHQPRAHGTGPGSAPPSASCCAATGPAPASRTGPRPTCRSSTRPPSCSARSTRACCAPPPSAEEEAAAARAAREEDERRPTSPTPNEVLELTGMAEMIDAERFAARHRDDEPYLTTAERAAADRTWAFGHVIVDEAQELSAMAWRMVMRRCPSRSMTIVGDLAQTGSAAGARSWAECSTPTPPGAAASAGSPSTTAPRPRSWRSPRTCSPSSTPACAPPSRCGRPA